MPPEMEASEGQSEIPGRDVQQRGLKRACVVNERAGHTCAGSHAKPQETVLRRAQGSSFLGIIHLLGSREDKGTHTKAPTSPHRDPGVASLCG